MGPQLLIPILVPLGFFALIFGIVYLQKKENLAMIDKDMNPKARTSRGPEPFRYLKWGLLLIGSGVGLFLASMLERFLDPRYDSTPLYFSLLAIGGGVGLVISYRLEMKELHRIEANSQRAPYEQ